MAMPEHDTHGGGGRPPAGREPLVDAPRVVWVMVALFVLAFFVQHLLMRIGGDVVVYRFGVWPARFLEGGAQALVRAGQPAGPLSAAVSYVTYAFLHGDLMHLTVNVLWFLAFGTVVARRRRGGFGESEIAAGVRFFLYFTLCAAGAGLVHTAINWGSQAPLVGASGGVAGLMAAASRFIGRPHHAPLWPLNAPTVVGFASAWFLINIATAFGGLGSAELRAISWEAHLGGYAAGLLLYPLFDRPKTRLYG